ncbi:MAG: DUF1802 family protein [Cytophagaceae bacterium]|jgi:hypothetical protein|nr:DUF1802 family protein [Cytophagaceae bacterium]
MTLAFKEWSCIVDALGKGKQSLILRKGGIQEEGDEFEMKGNEFVLFPTLYHQADAAIKPSWKPFLKHDSFYINPNKVLIKYFVKVADVQVLTDWDKVKRLHPFHAWSEAVIEERFTRWNNQIHMFVVQVFEFGASFELDLVPEYGGCTSWLKIEKNIEFVGRPVVNKTII